MYHLWAPSPLVVSVIKCNKTNLQISLFIISVMMSTLLPKANDAAHCQ